MKIGVFFYLVKMTMRRCEAIKKGI